jgi:murein L,D-transpeptidase YcbB/YkuD
MFRNLFLLMLLFVSTAVFADETPATPLDLSDLIDGSDIAPVTKKELTDFYALRKGRAAWNLTDEDALKKIPAFLDSLDALIAYHGLIKASYKTSAMRQLVKEGSADDRSKLEFLISACLLHLARDLHGDQVNFDDLYPGWTLHRKQINSADEVNSAINNGTLAALFDQLTPQAPAYHDLAQTLAAYRDIDARGGWKTISPGPPLHLHDHDPRVIQLRNRLAAENYVSATATRDDDFFDDGLSKALILYQDRNGLSPDGQMGGRTLESLNTPVAMRLLQVRANMERWRHMPEDFPVARYTLVNIPDFSVVIVENHTLLYRGIVIDGKPDRQTPFIASQITNMLINPYWHVPLSIARKDILPKLQKDSHYLEKLGFVIADRAFDPTGSQINWKQIAPEDFNFKLRQNPGDLNSLGQLKFNFANPFDVYMHGTPHQELFDKAERDFSSGCVRLEDPLRVGEILLSHNKEKGGWSAQRIADAIAEGKSIFIPLVQPMPIYFLYWTVFNDDNGQINFRKDIYGFDTALIDKLKSAENDK